MVLYILTFFRRNVGKYVAKNNPIIISIIFPNCFSFDILLVSSKDEILLTFFVCFYKMYLTISIVYVVLTYIICIYLYISKLQQ